MISSYRPAPIGFSEIARELEAALMCLDEGNIARTGIILHRVIASLTAHEKSMLIQEPPIGMGPFARLPPV